MASLLGEIPVSRADLSGEQSGAESPEGLFFGPGASGLTIL